MPAMKQYLRVKRVSVRDLFLLGRVDLADGKRFRPGDVTAACKGCRQVSKREYWLKNDNTCPFCGGRESMLFSGRRDLTAGAMPPVAYAGRFYQMRPDRPVPIRLLILVAAVMFGAAMLLLRGGGSSAGFRQAADGHFYYQDASGQRYTDGDYNINGEIYHFSNGFLSGESAFTLNNRLQLTDADGLLRQGWCVYQGRFVFVTEKGVENQRVPGIKSSGFYELEGLGRVFITDQDAPGNGWIAYQGGLYHLLEGKADPVREMTGYFDELGRYFPEEACFVETPAGTCYLDAGGNLARGLAAHQGFVYALNDQGMLRRGGTEEVTGVPIAHSGILIPEKDTLVSLPSGGMILEGRTGLIRTGWTVLDGSIYCAGGDGVVLAGVESGAPQGTFDGAGRFLPRQAGRLQLAGITCFVRADGSLAVGAVKEGDSLCVYDQNGCLRVNGQVGTAGVTDESGRLRPYAPGMVEIDGEYYCLTQQGAVLTGWQRVGKLYYFDPETGRRARAGALVNGLAYTLSPEGYFAPAAEGLYQLGEDAYYVLTDGTLASGWRAVDGMLTFFDPQTGKRTEDGAASGQTGWIQKSDARFYVLEDGTAARGWHLISGRVYYFDPQTGSAVSGTRQIDGKIYRFREDGALSPEAPTALTMNGVSYRIGVSGRPEGGFLFEGGHLYYYDPNTAVLSASLPRGTDGWVSSLGGYMIPQQAGVFSAAGGRYYLDASGTVLTGWFISDGQLYFADPVTGMLAQDGPAEGGSFREGVFTPDLDGTFTADGREYLFSDGKLAQGWVLIEDGVAYVAPGTARAAVSVTVEIDGVSRRFDSAGRFAPSGNVLLSIRGERYLVLTGGALPAQAGVYPAEGKLVYAAAGGKVAMETQGTPLLSSAVTIRDGVIIPLTPGIVNVNGDAYLLAEDGAYDSGLRVVKEKLYMFGPDGKMVADAYGFSETGAYLPAYPGLNYLFDSFYWFRDTLGTVGIGMIEDEKGNVRYADAQGILQSGLVDLEGGRYYFYDMNKDFVMARNQFLTHISDGEGTFEFYAGEDGRLATGWVELEGAQHYFDQKGHMLYDTIQDGRYINVYGEAR